MLPENKSFSLQGHSRPGDLNPSQAAKPKQAMVIRLTAEALEALEAFPDIPSLEIEFGQNPTMYVGDKEYSMVAAREVCSHDLYLRTYTASKPLAPLRLRANITGKFKVQPGLEKAVANIRAGTQQLKESRARGIVKIDAPPSTTNTSNNPPARRKKPAASTSMFRKAAPQPDYIKVPDHSSLPIPSSSSSVRKASPIPPKPADPTLKLRLIKCLARSPRSTEEAFRLLSDSDRSTVSQVLNEVAEQKEGKMWSLTNQSWLQVRPYEWEKCSEAERKNMAQQARAAAIALKVPESDSVWSYFRPRAPAPSIVGSSTQPPLKRPTHTKDPKEKKPLTTTAVRSTNAESSRASPSLASRETKPAPRRPGSGYQVHRSTSVDVASPNMQFSSGIPGAQSMDSHLSSLSGDPINTRKIPPAPSVSRPTPSDRGGGGAYARKHPSALSKNPIPPQPTSNTSKTTQPKFTKVKREEEEEEEGEVESDEGRYAKRPRAQSPSELHSREDPKERDVKRVKSQQQSLSLTRHRELPRDKEHRPPVPNDQRSDHKRAKEEKDKTHKLRDTVKVEPTGSKVKARDPEMRQDQSPAIKRKLVERDDAADTNVAKKRKTEGGKSIPTQRDLSLPKKPEVPKATIARQRISKEAVPVPKIKKETESSAPRIPTVPPQSPSRSSSTTTSSQRGGRKRASPVYTSSEEDGETKPSIPVSKALSRPPLPTDRKALRARYHRTYSEYIMTFARVSQQRNLLVNLEGGSGSEIDVDDDIMEPEALEKLSKKHEVLKGELEAITDAMGFDVQVQ